MVIDPHERIRSEAFDRSRFDFTARPGEGPAFGSVPAPARCRLMGRATRSLFFSLCAFERAVSSRLENPQ